MKKRIDIDANYKALFFNGKTIRQKIDINKPILAPKYAEIEDCAINSRCEANCFVEGTLVRTNNGIKPIETIKIGDIVLSFNKNSNIFEEKEVYDVFRNDYSGDLIQIELENNKIIICTPNHKFLTMKGWVEATNLNENDDLVDYQT